MKKRNTQESEVFCVALNNAYYRCCFLVDAFWHFGLPLMLLLSVEVLLWCRRRSLLLLKFGNQALKNLLLLCQPTPTQFTTQYAVCYWDTVGHHSVIKLRFSTACRSLTRRFSRCNNAMRKKVSERKRTPAASLWKCLWMVARFLKLVQQHPLSFHCCRSLLCLYLVVPPFTLFMSSLPRYKLKWNKENPKPKPK